MANKKLEIIVSNSGDEITIKQGNHTLKMETSSFIKIINESQKDMVYRDENTKNLLTVGEYFV